MPEFHSIKHLYKYMHCYWPSMAFISHPSLLGKAILVATGVRPSALNSTVTGIHVAQVTMTAESYRIGEGWINIWGTALQKCSLILYFFVNADLLAEGGEERLPHHFL